MDIWPARELTIWIPRLSLGRGNQSDDYFTGGPGKATSISYVGSAGRSGPQTWSQGIDRKAMNTTVSEKAALAPCAGPEYHTAGFHRLYRATMRMGKPWGAGDLAYGDGHQLRRPGRANPRSVDECIPYPETARLQSHCNPHRCPAGM